MKKTTKSCLPCTMLAYLSPHGTLLPSTIREKEGDSGECLRKHGAKYRYDINDCIMIRVSINAVPIIDEDIIMPNDTKTARLIEIPSITLCEDDDNWEYHITIYEDIVDIQYKERNKELNEMETLSRQSIPTNHAEQVCRAIIKLINK